MRRTQGTDLGKTESPLCLISTSKLDVDQLSNLYQYLLFLSSKAMKNSPSQPYIKLDQFLKWQGIAQTGGEAKIIIKEGQVEVNGIEEIRRGRKLVTGDLVTVAGITLRVDLN